MKHRTTEKPSWRRTLLRTAGTALAAVLVSAAVWVAFHGVPLMGLPGPDEVRSVTLVSLDGGTKTVTDAENIELLVKAANLLNYTFGTPDTTDPELTVTYELNNGEVCVLSANHTTVWWKGRAHPVKQQDVFCNVVQGLFFSGDYQ